jgi:hypothetical protein
MTKANRTFSNWCKNDKELMLLMIVTNLLIYSFAYITNF